MTEEEKSLLLKDLCARLPYGVKIQSWYGEIITSDLNTFPYSMEEMDKEDMWDQLSGFKPYLRPLSSMTEEEILELYKIAYDTWYSDPLYYKNEEWITFKNSIKNNSLCFKNSVWLSDIDKVIDWLNVKYFDYRGLIERDLAQEALKGMYKIK